VTRLIPQFIIHDGNTSRVGADRIALLEAVRDHGSISAAGRAIGLSYKAAWDGVNALNNLFPSPLVCARPGGVHGGGAVLTAHGEDIISAFHMVETELAHVMKDLHARLESKGIPNASKVLGSLHMRTSARNALRGEIKSITFGPINSELIIRLNTHIDLAAVITTASVKTLNLHIGAIATALIKASFVTIGTTENMGRVSTRNQLLGTIIKRDEGEINSEYTLDIGEGKTITAIVTKESATTLDLKVGDRACAFIKASHIILAVDQ